MKLLILLLLAPFAVSAQLTYYIRSDSTKIEKTGGSNELFIKNSTRAINGVLTNIGNGRTQFIASRKVGDTLFVGKDTIVGFSSVTVANVGSGHRVYSPQLLGLRTLFPGINTLWDSTTNASGLTVHADTTTGTTKLATQGDITRYAGVAYTSRALFEDSCLILTRIDGTKDTTCFTGGSGGITREELQDTASAIRADFPAPGSSATWGSITGTLSSQTDLQTALDGKVNDTGNETIAGIKTLSSNPILSAISANRVLYTTTGGAITSTANFNFDGSFGRLAGQWSIGATHSGTTNRNFEVTGYMNVGNATALSGFYPYIQIGGWEFARSVSPSGTNLVIGGAASQWAQLTFHLSGVDRMNFTATATNVNATGIDRDFTVAGDNDANAFVVKGSNDFVGIGVAPGSITQKLHLAGNFRFSGALMPNNAAGSSGQVLTSAGAGSPPTWTTMPTLAHSTYTPTLTNTTNIASSSANVTGYYRVGDMVTVFGTLTVTPTAELTDSELGVSIPVASGFAASHEGGGSGSLVSGTNNNNSVAIDMDATNDRARFRFHAPADGSGITMTFIFSYKITLE